MTREKSVSISSQTTNRGVGWFLVFFFSIFMMMGGAAFYLLTWPTAKRLVEARSWVETSCVVISSKRKTRDNGDGTTSTIDIRYYYFHDGKKYISNVYNFQGIEPEPGEQSSLVRRHPPGSKTICFVNPENPLEAVIDPAARWGHLLLLIPVVFFLVGSTGVIFGVRWAVFPSYGKPASRLFSRRGRKAKNKFQAGPVILKPKQSPFGKFIAVIFIALFWNSIVSVFVWQAFEGWQAGRGDWFLTIFMIPFVLIGIVLIVMIPYQLLALFNPRPTLTLSSAATPIGGSVDVRWKISGKTSAIQRLRIYLEGREVATYRRGTNTYTDTNVFLTIDLIDTASSMKMRNGHGSLNIPGDTIHSFESDNNKIVWALKVAGEIDRWPDIDDEFDFTVRPVDQGGGL